jgi:hypothetical protein
MKLKTLIFSRPKQTKMYLSLLDHIAQFVTLDSDEKNTILTYLDHHKVAKKQHLL